MRRRCVKETERRGSRAQVSAHPEPSVFPVFSRDPKSSSKTALLLFSEFWRAKEMTNKKALGNSTQLIPDKKWMWTTNK